jgi:hypothetical protein
MGVAIEKPSSERANFNKRGEIINTTSHGLNDHETFKLYYCVCVCVCRISVLFMFCSKKKTSYVSVGLTCK